MAAAAGGAGGGVEDELHTCYYDAECVLTRHGLTYTGDVVLEEDPDEFDGIPRSVSVLAPTSPAPGEFTWSLPRRRAARKVTRLNALVLSRDVKDVRATAVNTDGQSEVCTLSFLPVGRDMAQRLTSDTRAVSSADGARFSMSQLPAPVYGDAVAFIVTAKVWLPPERANERSPLSLTIFINGAGGEPVLLPPSELALCGAPRATEHAAPRVLATQADVDALAVLVQNFSDAEAEVVAHSAAASGLMDAWVHVLGLDMRTPDGFIGAAFERWRESNIDELKRVATQAFVNSTSREDSLFTKVVELFDSLESSLAALSAAQRQHASLLARLDVRARDATFEISGANGRMKGRASYLLDWHNTKTSFDGYFDARLREVRDSINARRATDSVVRERAEEEEVTLLFVCEIPLGRGEDAPVEVGVGGLFDDADDDDDW